MKIAIVHELLTMKGGAEQVLMTLLRAYPQADVYTLLAKNDIVQFYELGNKLHKSSLQKRIESIPLLNKLLPLNHHVLLPWLSATAKQWDFSAYDVVISSSSAFAHHINVPPHCKHVSYIHSPARYLWDRTFDVQKNLPWLKRWYFWLVSHKLRQKDASIEHNNCTILAASQEVQRRIELYWRTKSTVLYPAIAQHWFEENLQRQAKEQGYYLVVSTLARYKRIDLAIEACNSLQVPLKIIGSGSDLRRLQSLAGNTIQFLGHVPNTDLRTWYQGAKAVLFVGDEDFGLVPLEAMSQGTPVIAFKKGGALETINPGVTGEFFTEPTSQSLAAVLTTFNKNTYDSKRIVEYAKKFSEGHFIHAMKNIVSNS